MFLHSVNICCTILQTLAPVSLMYELILMFFVTCLLLNVLIFMVPAELLLSSTVASHSCTATILFIFSHRAKARSKSPEQFIAFLSPLLQNNLHLQPARL